MTDPRTGTGGIPAREDEAPRSGQVPDPEPQRLDRAAALAEGAPGIPPKFVFWALAVVLVVSLGGLLGEHVFSSAGLNPVATPTPRSPVHVAQGVLPRAPAPAQSIGAPLPSFMDLSTLRAHRARPFTLIDQRGATTSVPDPAPDVVVLSFFNAPCNDICPVEAAEIEQADHDLGSAAVDVEFVTVNTDPSALAPSAETAVFDDTGLNALPNWHMLTGPLASLNPVWRSYGVSITVEAKTGLEAHTDVMDFIDGAGYVRYRATPFADESRTGTFSLPAASVARWGQGIATYASRILGR
jgi:cytochrome oxidase Cu insertion factor (SCO1/SenC/PrrC family)